MPISPVTATVRAGAMLHLVQVTIMIPDIAGISLQPNSLYSYDVLGMPTFRQARWNIARIWSA